MKEWIGGNKKTEALILLLKVTGQLKSLEVVFSTLVPNVGDSTAPFSAFISTLHRSEEHLKHLRLVGIDSDIKKPGFSGLDSFRGIKILALDRMTLFCLLNSESPQPLPQGLEIIFLPFYMFPWSDIESGNPKEDFIEDVLLCTILRRSKTLLPASLKEMVVPLSPVLMRGIQVDSTHVNYQKWVEGRSLLEREILNTKGRIKLRKVGRGAIGAYVWRLTSLVINWKILFYSCSFLTRLNPSLFLSLTHTHTVGDASELFMSSLRWLSD